MPVHVVTHSGSFHADEVHAIAALRILHGDAIEIIRTRDPARIAQGDIVVDVGRIYDPARKHFDHHQGGAGQRENGIPFAAFGLVWKEYGSIIAGSEESADRIDRRLVQAVDAIDVGVSISEALHEGVLPYDISAAVGAFTPTWQEASETTDGAFMQAVVWTQSLLVREIIHAQAFVAARRLLEACYAQAADCRVLVLDAPYPFHEFTDTHPEIVFVIAPASSGEGWKAEAARIHSNSFALRQPFPESWRGKEGNALQEVTGVTDAVFCHSTGFAAYARSAAGAKKLVQLALS